MQTLVLIQMDSEFRKLTFWIAVQGEIIKSQKGADNGSFPLGNIYTRGRGDFSKKSVWDSNRVISHTAFC